MEEYRQWESQERMDLSSRQATTVHRHMYLHMLAAVFLVSASCIQQYRIEHLKEAATEMTDLTGNQLVSDYT